MRRLVAILLASGLVGCATNEPSSESDPDVSVVAPSLVLPYALGSAIYRAFNEYKVEFAIHDSHCFAPVAANQLMLKVHGTFGSKKDGFKVVAIPAKSFKTTLKLADNATYRAVLWHDTKNLPLASATFTVVSQDIHVSLKVAC